jgi:pimeloyl-ACP methyl ester carboxylesterase
VAPVLEDMVPGVVVVGHSFGGSVALHLAAGRPDRVKALVLTGVPRLLPDDRPTPKFRFRLSRALRRAGLVSEDRMEAARRRYGSADYRNAEGVMRQVLVRTLAEDYEDQLAAIHCPVTLVWGDDDTAAPLAMARAAADRLPGATLTVCAGAGHLTPLTIPQVLHRSVRRALG